MTAFMISGKKVKKENLQSFTKQLFKNRQKDRKIDNMKKMTKEKFDAYFVVQQSGVTNMFAVRTVIDYANKMCDVRLTKEDCFCIMENYSKLKKKYS